MNQTWLLCRFEHSTECDECKICINIGAVGRPVEENTWCSAYCHRCAQKQDHLISSKDELELGWWKDEYDYFQVPIGTWMCGYQEEEDYPCLEKIPLDKAYCKEHRLKATMRGV